MGKRKLQPDQINRIVVRAPNWLGDVVMSVPALRELRSVFPDSHITVATRTGSADVFMDTEFVDDVLVQDGRRLRRGQQAGVQEIGSFLGRTAAAQLVGVEARVAGPRVGQGRRHA